MNELVCSVDMGTSHIKVGLFDCRGTCVQSVSAPVSEAATALSATDVAAQAALAQRLIARLTARVAPAAIHAVAIASQRATVVPISADHAVVGGAIGWQENRCNGAMLELDRTLGRGRFLQLTGLPPSFLWSVCKMLWCRQVDAARWNAATRWVLLGDYLLHQLGTEDYVTDLSNASLTGLLELAKGEWSDEILEAAGISREMLSRIVASGQPVGALSSQAAAATGLLQGTPLISGGGDQQCAALGIGVTEPGQAGLCIGTAAVLSCPTDGIPEAQGGFFLTAHVVPGRYVREGIFSAFGSCVRWALGALGVPSPGELELLAATAPAGAGGILFLPFLGGVGSPDFDAAVRASFVGIGEASSRSCLARAVLEGLAFETRRMLDAVDAGSSIPEIVVTGGAGGVLTMALLADITGRVLVAHTSKDATLAGAALLAWRGIGGGSDPAQDSNLAGSRTAARLIPSPPAHVYEALYPRYCATTRALRQLSLDGGSFTGIVA